MRVARSTSLPGAELVEAGLRDLDAGRRSAEALLVARASHRLRALGITVPAHDIVDPDAELYALLSDTVGARAHSRYNALTRRLVSYLKHARATPR